MIIHVRRWPITTAGGVVPNTKVLLKQKPAQLAGFPFCARPKMAEMLY